MKRFLLLCLLLPMAVLATTANASATAAGSRNHTQITKLVTAFVQQQTASLSGKVSYQIEDLDPRITLAPCARPEPFLPGGSQLIGKTSVGVRCNEKNGWSILIPVQIKVTQELLISARQLSLGHVLQQQDLATQSVEMSRSTGFTTRDQVMGKVLRYSIAAGQILRDDMLRAPYSVTQGQTVQITSQGPGFSVRNEGVALNNASEGQNVQIRVSSGRVISGIARNGGVEINP